MEEGDHIAPWLQELKSQHSNLSVQETSIIGERVVSGDTRSATGVGEPGFSPKLDLFVLLGFRRGLIRFGEINNILETLFVFRTQNLVWCKGLTLVYAEDQYLYNQLHDCFTNI